MRDLNDLVPVQVAIESKILLDLEQLQHDPVWFRISAPYNLAEPEHLAAALEAYVREYLVKEDNKVLRYMPSHCGPGDVLVYHVEVDCGTSNGCSGAGSPVTAVAATDEQ